MSRLVAPLSALSRVFVFLGAGFHLVFRLGRLLSRPGVGFEFGEEFCLVKPPLSEFQKPLYGKNPGRKCLPVLKLGLLTEHCSDGLVVSVSRNNTRRAPPIPPVAPTKCVC